MNLLRTWIDAFRIDPRTVAAIANKAVDDQDLTRPAAMQLSL
jgi:hypothetical protein